ncbi:MAG: AAA family ATPase [Bacteroidia bacterium]|nr:AAA family ATPase [Bacteroidia bacterium]
MENEMINNLREAIKFSPDNIPLRLHLAQTLKQYSYFSEAAEEYKNVLKRSSDHDGAKLGLAECMYEEGQYSTALVIAEELLGAKKPAGAAHLLYARLLVKERDRPRAADHYRKALEINPELSDPELDEMLKVPNFAEDIDIGAGEGTVHVERPRVNFSQVGGMEKVKDEVRMKIIHPLTHRELYEAYGKKIGGGILLYGPPGCGKTHLARATAGEVKAGFITVGIHDVLDMYIGQSESKLHGIFEVARAQRPTVLFFDEVDALGASRTDMRQSAGRHLINQFLAELDGMSSDNDGLLILAATNTPWHLDSAFRRPGRFDRIIFVPPPDEPARAEIFRIRLTGKPTLDIDFGKIAAKTKDFSGADIQNTIDHAIEEKLKASFKTGIPEPLTTRDLLNAAALVKPSTREWFNTARNYALYSNESGIYDDILQYLNLK